MQSKLIYLFLSLFVFSANGYCQQAENILIDRIEGTKRLDCAGQQFAGTFSIGTISGMTNDVTTDRMFLCAGDMVELIHDGNAILDGDPNMATPAGIGYAWYECPPDAAFSGPDDLSTIISDPCVFDLVDDPALGIFIFTDNINGNAVFSNLAFMQANLMIQTIPEYYNGGSPIEIWFAPITYDRMTATGQAAFENGSPCTHVNTDAAFSVVYLNPVQITNPLTNVGGDPLAGSFVPVGGVSEFDGTSYNEINIFLTSNPAVTANYNGAGVTHSNTVSFTVPQSGEYTIEIIDEKGCSSTNTIYLGVDPIIFDFSCVDGQPGDTVCVSVSVTNFMDIAAVQLYFMWDQQVLDYVGVQNFGLASMVQGEFNQTGPSNLSFVHLDFTLLGENLPDGSVLFDICFQVVGLPGSDSPVTFQDRPDQEVADINSVPIPIQFNDCDVNVLPATNLAAFLSSCGPPNGIGDGDFTVTIFGGTAPYTYTYVNTANATINGAGMVGFPGGSSTENVPPGNYNVIIFDLDGNMVTYNIDVDAISMQVSITSFEPTCYDFTNGRIIIEVADGTPPYSYVWGSLTIPSLNGSGFIFQGGSGMVNSLPGGNYFIEVEDERGCTQIFNEILDDHPFQIDVDATIDATCIGVNDGAISLVISGGSPYFDGSYRIDFGQIVDAPTGANGQIALGALSPGDYCMTIRDSIPSCDTVFCFTIGSTTNIGANIVTVPETCRGASDGEVTIGGLTNGSPMGPYNFVILDSMNVVITTGGPANNFIFSPLAAGTYHTIVESTAGCLSDTLDFVILPGDSISIVLDTTTLDDCIDGPPQFATGSATFTIMGGNLPFNLDAGAGTVNGTSIEDLDMGNYILTVTDASNCSATIPFTIENYQQNSADFLSFETNGSPCAGGTITILYNGVPPSGGVGISWVGSGETTATIPMNAEGIYSVFVNDLSIHCQLSADTMILCDDVLGIDLTTFQPLCNSAAIGGPYLGGVLADTFNAVAPVTYFWSTMDTTVNNGLLNGLAPGIYYVTVTDALDSMVVDSFEIIEPEAIIQVYGMIDSTNCNESCDGGVDITPVNNENDTTTFKIFWNDGMNSDTGFVFNINGLCGGFQPFIVSQNGVCFYQDSVEIPSPAPLSGNLIDLQNVSCFNAQDGSVEIEGIGGTPGYTYLWNTGSTDPDISLLGPDTVEVTVTDSRFCTFIDTFIITQPDSLMAMIDSSASSPLGCGGQNDGVISVTTSGGNSGMFSYNWDPNVSTSAVAIGLQAGQYSITVTDGNGCNDTTSYTVTAPPEIFFTIPDVATVTCFGEQALFTVDTAFGGSGSGFTYAISNGQAFPIGELIPLPAGMYTISVSDSTGCTKDTLIDIVQPNPVVVEIQPQDPIVDLGGMITLQAILVSGDHPVAGYSWDPPAFLSCDTCQFTNAGNNTPITYTVTVIDTAGCIGTAEVFVDVNTNRNVFIPNAFSPNNDGHNEEFQVFSDQGVTAINLFKVFDRWGEEVFSISGVQPSPQGSIGWDGQFKGNPMQPGVYVYMIEILFDDGVTLLYRGDITLIR